MFKSKFTNFSNKWLGIILLLISWIIEEVITFKYLPLAQNLFTQLILIIFPFFLLFLGLILFIKKGPKKNIKIYTLILFLPMILNIFFLVSLNSYCRLTEDEALKLKEPQKCLQIYKNRTLNFFDELFETNFTWTRADSCFSAVARTSDLNEPKVCQLLLTEMTQEECITDMALRRQDPEICRYISTSEGKSECYMIVKLTIEAQEKPFLKECLKFSKWSSDRDICLRNLAIEKIDKELCKYVRREGNRFCLLDVKILTEGYLEPCRRFVTDIIPYTSSGEYVWREKELEKKIECVYNTAIKNSDIELCKLLKDSGLGKFKFTWDDCITNIAVNTKDIKICDELNNEYLIRECTREVSKAK